jgi:hypothetical protein
MNALPVEATPPLFSLIPCHLQFQHDGHMNFRGRSTTTTTTKHKVIKIIYEKYSYVLVTFSFVA